MSIYKFLSVILFLVLALNVEARPISYSEGSTLMYFSNSMKDSIYFHYSPTYKYSIGVEGAKDKFFNQNESYLRLTYLIDRKNTEIAQRNLYFQSGISLHGEGNHFYGIQGDWETRRWFSGFGYKEVKNDIRDYSDQYLQLGVAPYIGDYGDLHTWVMIKSKKNSLTKSWSTYPLLKVFRGDVLIEFGYNSKTEWDVYIVYSF